MWSGEKCDFDSSMVVGVRWTKISEPSHLFMYNSLDTVVYTEWWKKKQSSLGINTLLADRKALSKVLHFAAVVSRKSISEAFHNTLRQMGYNVRSSYKGICRLTHKGQSWLKILKILIFNVFSEIEMHFAIV